MTGIFRSYLQHDPCQAGTFALSNPAERNQLATDYNMVPDTTPGPSVSAVVVADGIEDEDDPNVDYLSPSTMDSIYTHYQAETVFRTHRMRAQMPIASPMSPGVDTSDTSAVVTLGRPQTRMILRMRAERIGDWPEYPDPETLGSSVVGGIQVASDQSSPYPQIRIWCLKDKLKARGATKNANNQYIFFAERELIYALSRNPMPQDIMKVTHLPQTLDDVGGTYVGDGTHTDQTLTNSNKWF